MFFVGPNNDTAVPLKNIERFYVIKTLLNFLFFFVDSGMGFCWEFGLRC